MKQPVPYMMSNKPYGTLYKGVTLNLPQRIYQHQTATKGFTAKYKCKILVYYEVYDDMYTAISLEKQIKGGSRQDKLRIIENFNPKWQGLSKNVI